MNKKISDFLQFITVDIWRVTESEVTKRKFSLYNIIKTIYVTIKQFVDDRIAAKASALTYSTLLAIVPMLAILFAIARGFGFDKLMETQLFANFGGQTETTEAILTFVDSYLEHAKGGIFIGVGLAMLLWTVLNLINNIEVTFNHIWQVKKSRNMYRKITDYFSMFLLMPILIVFSSGVTLFMSTVFAKMEDYILLGSLSKFLIKLIPFAITWLMFTGLYVFMPNTNVRFKHALPAGILAGTIYQFFQFFYISGQIWVSKYNAIYGSFAALPLFLLWLQTSWTICLFGVQLTYTSQNIRFFSFDRDTRNVSRRYRDFISLLIMSLICKRFEQQDKPYTADEISSKHRIPIRLVNRTLSELQEIKMIHEVLTGEKEPEIGYQPSIDLSQLSVGLLLERIDQFGSEDFKIDKEKEFGSEWEVLLSAREKYLNSASEILVKDL
ncbi:MULTISPECIES: YihY/virulence factor BrkB family protein [Bacteroides]|uniref:YihY/virulence factor BrkB family protein n=1 Tax=Bacteroides TaxID=816 RepID=UPI001DB8AEAA|nr:MULTISPECIES: YihY/virulence factor BrkB family protein [Bacteroides]HJD91730.1 YihY/virulence factor BrkB family protein [Bacteroides coprosuis]